MQVDITSFKLRYSGNPVHFSLLSIDNIPAFEQSSCIVVKVSLRKHMLASICLC